jgi:hypothetical protein
MKNSIVKLDVRDDLRKGVEPFSKIMGAVSALRPDEQLLLIAPFEPVPLFSVLKRQGFEHVSRELESGDFEVLFTRDPNARVAAEIPKTPPLNKGKAIKNASAKSARARRFRKNGDRGCGRARIGTAAAVDEDSGSAGRFAGKRRIARENGSSSGASLRPAGRSRFFWRKRGAT